MREARPTSPCHPHGVCVTLLITAVGSCTQVAREVQGAWRRAALRNRELQQRATGGLGDLHGVRSQAPFGASGSDEDGGGGKPGGEAGRTAGETGER